MVTLPGNTRGTLGENGWVTLDETMWGNMGRKLTAGQLFMTKAYRCAPGGEVAIYGYLNVVFSMIWQILVFNSIPVAAVFIGAGLILLGGWINYRNSGNRVTYQN